MLRSLLPQLIVTQTSYFKDLVVDSLCDLILHIPSMSEASGVSGKFLPASAVLCLNLKLSLLRSTKWNRFNDYGQFILCSTALICLHWTLLRYTGGIREQGSSNKKNQSKCWMTVLYILRFPVLSVRWTSVLKRWRRAMTWAARQQLPRPRQSSPHRKRYPLVSVRTFVIASSVGRTPEWSCQPAVSGLSLRLTNLLT